MTGLTDFKRIVYEPEKERCRRHIARLRQLLRAVHPHVLELSVTDEAPEFKALLRRIEKEI